MKQQDVVKSKAVPDYMMAQIAQMVAEGAVKVLRPKAHEQSARAFPRGGRGAIWYDKQIKGNK